MMMFCRRSIALFLATTTRILFVESFTITTSVMPTAPVIVQIQVHASSSVIALQTSCTYPSQMKTTIATTSNTALSYGRDADMMEMSVGGKRYEMVQLPDSLIDTTLFVGNLCEFVTDDMLSSLFQEVSTLKFIPACVIRKADMSSLKYGFVTFPNEEEKLAALDRFSGYKLNNKPMRLEEIRDNPRHGRVRVPDQFITYSAGEVKRTRDGSKNTMRMARMKTKKSVLKPHSKKNRKKSNNSNSIQHRDFMSRLSNVESRELGRAIDIRGYITLEWNSYNQNGGLLRPSHISSIHNKWCRSLGKPQIILCKAARGRAFDNVIIDLSPLLIGSVSEDVKILSEFMAEWKELLTQVSETSSMVVKSLYTEDCVDNINDSTLKGDIRCSLPRSSLPDNQSTKDLPLIFGVFEGERPMAKSMAKELCLIWQLIEASEDEKRGKQGHRKKKSAYEMNSRKGKDRTYKNLRRRRRDSR